MLRIKEAREARGWTQEQLAHALGTTQQTIQRWESGTVSPKTSKILEISEALGITVSYLFGLHNDESDTHELELVEIYRSLDERDQKRLLAFARAMSE